MTADFNVDVTVCINGKDYIVTGDGYVNGRLCKTYEDGYCSSSDFVKEDVEIFNYWFQRIEDETDIEEGGPEFKELWSALEEQAYNSCEV